MPQQGYDPRISEIGERIISPPDTAKLEKDAVRTGILCLDSTIPGGLNVQAGEMIVIQGKEKMRKTTLALNMVRTLCKEGRLKGHVLWETLESGASPVTVKEALIAMEATAVLVRRVWGELPSDLPRKSVVYDGKEYKYMAMKQVEDYKDPDTGWPLFQLGPRRLLGSKRSPMQQSALEEAKEIVQGWPIVIAGAPKAQGQTLSLSTPQNGVGLLSDHRPYKRWLEYIKSYDVKVIVVDHSSAYSVPNAYDLVTKYITHATSVVAEHNVILISIAQTSLSSKREYAVGGARQAQEAEIVLRTEYNPATPYNLQVIPVQSRSEPPPRMNIPIERFSGLTLPSAYPRATGK